MISQMEVYLVHKQVNAGVIAKINLNGTLENYITFTGFQLGEAGMWKLLLFFDFYMSAIQYLVNDECDIHDKDGNQISFSFPGDDFNYVGFTSDLDFIRKFPYKPCGNLYIDQAIILPREYVVTSPTVVVTLNAIVFTQIGIL